ncbi:MAG: hypothetical protein WAK93_00925 [Solirubrobacteraceae bacterium]
MTLWVLQPHSMANEKLAPTLLITLVVAAVLGMISGYGRALLAPLAFGLVIGTLCAATTNGDLGRAGEFVLSTVWGIALATATWAGIWLRRGISYASGLEPRRWSLLERWATTGAAMGGLMGAVAGLIVGLMANPATAWFAIFELGVPAGVAGGLIGCVAAVIMTAARRIRDSAAPFA